MISRKLSVPSSFSHHHHHLNHNTKFSSSLPPPILLFSSIRTLVSSRYGATAKADRSLLPKNYFVGGKSPTVSVPKKSRSHLVNSSNPKFANAGFVERWRDDVLKEFLPEETAAMNKASKTKVSFASPSSSTTSKNSSSSEKKSATIPHPGSTQEGKFKCSTCSNTWSARIRERNDIQQDLGCPHCFKKNQLSLEISEPGIAQEWDLARNRMFTSLHPGNTSIKSEAHVWWICNLCSGSFVSSVKDRVEGNVQCPTCIDAKLDPTMSKEDTETMKEMMLKREQTASFTNHNNNDDANDEGAIRNPLNKIETVRNENFAPWTCTKCGVAWKGSSFLQRFEQHTLCPSCSGQVTTKTNSLTINRPDVVRSIVFRDRSNRKYEIQQLTIQSKDKYWFRCWTCRKEYEMSIRERCQYGSSSPDGSRFYGKSAENQSTANPCPHCQRARRVIALENIERGGVDGYVAAKKVDLKSPYQSSPLNQQHIASRSLSGPN